MRALPARTRYVWGTAHEILPSSAEALLGTLCHRCRRPLRAGDWARWRFGPRGGQAFHDDCTDAHEGDVEWA